MTRQEGEQHRGRASGGIGGRRQGSANRRTGQPSDTIVAGIPGNQESGVASDDIRGRIDHRAYTGSFQRGRGGRHLGNRLDGRGNGEFTPSFDNRNRVRDGGSFTSSFGAETRAWDDGRFNRSLYRSPYAPCVFSCTLH